MKAETQIIEENFVFTAGLKKNVVIIGVIGLILAIIGLVTVSSGGEHSEGHATMEAASDLAAVNGLMVEDGHHGGSHFHWTQRLISTLWVNNMFFTGMAIAAVFFFAIQFIARAGWSVLVTRVMAAFGYFIPVAALLVGVVFLFGNHDLFHWTHSYLYDKLLADGTPNPEYDAIIDGKKAYLNMPFYVGRMIFLFIGWIFFSYMLRKIARMEDLKGGLKYYKKQVKVSGAYIIFFALSCSISAWDWIMSIDTHWFSTMFGWYVFASWFVSALAAITLGTVILKEMGYLKAVNENHLHDLGKFVFAFSVFWTYIWFSQFLLIYYANIPEEGIYFLERLQSDIYGKFIFINLFLNFFFPFLVLMTRDAKRKMIMLKIVCTVVLIGHWLDFYLMIFPGTLGENGGFGLLEIGFAMLYLSLFAFVVFTGLTRLQLIPKNHPMLEESMHHST